MIYRFSLKILLPGFICLLLFGGAGVLKANSVSISHQVSVSSSTGNNQADSSEISTGSESIHSRIEITNNSETRVYEYSSKSDNTEQNTVANNNANKKSVKPQPNNYEELRAELERIINQLAYLMSYVENITN